MTVPLADIGRCHWSKALLDSARIAPTARNITTFVAWAIAEGGWWNNAAIYNPLNTTQPFDGSHSMNSVGVQAYRSEADGLTATIRTLRYYPVILKGLGENRTPDEMTAIIGASSWGTSGHLMLQVVPRASLAVALVFPPKGK